MLTIEQNEEAPEKLLNALRHALADVALRESLSVNIKKAVSLSGVDRLMEWIGELRSKNELGFNKVNVVSR